MSSDLHEQVVASGIWLYSGVHPKCVEVVRLPHDYWFDLPGDDGRERWEQHPPAADGFFYYVRADGGDFLDSSPFSGVEAAQAWADTQPWGPVKWDDTGEA